MLNVTILLKNSMIVGIDDGGEMLKYESLGSHCCFMQDKESIDLIFALQPVIKKPACMN